MKIWLYWDNFYKRETPGYIKLCLRSLTNYCKYRHSIHILNRCNLDHYIDNVPNALYRIEQDIFDNSARGFIRKLNRERRASSNVAIRLDYIRLRLLYEYGGLWLDADCVTMSDYGDVEYALAQYELVGVAKTSHGDSHISNGFLAANRGSDKLREIIEEQENIISKKYVKWGEIGGLLLAKNLSGYGDIFLFNEEKALPVPWQEAHMFFEDKPLSVLERYDPFCCMLYNKTFPVSFKSTAPAELCGQPILISRLFDKHAT